MFFVSFNNLNIWFIETSYLILKNFTILEALPATKKVKLIYKSEFAKVAQDKNTIIFVMNSDTLLGISIYLSRKVQLGLLLENV